MPLVLLCSILNLNHYSWYNHTLVLCVLVCSFSLSSLLLLFFFALFLHLHVQPYLFLSYLMIIFYVLNIMYVLS